MRTRCAGQVVWAMSRESRDLLNLYSWRTPTLNRGGANRVIRVTGVMLHAKALSAGYRLG